MTIVEDMTKNAIQTFTGRMLDPLRPDLESIDIFDIAHHLSLLSRFNGACSHFYSIAQHSVYCYDQATRYNYPEPIQEKLALALLMHDAAEAYIGDITRSVKRAVPLFKEIERKLMAAINERFDLPRVEDYLGFDLVVPEVDNRMLVTERVALMPPGVVWNVEQHFDMYRDFQIEQWKPWEAELLFLQKFHQHRPDLVPAGRLMTHTGAQFND